MTIDQLAESHLATVQREIESLKQRVKEAEVDVQKLQSYFEEGVKVLNDFRRKPEPTEVTQEVPAVQTNQYLGG
jgi:hypothetical protein